MINRTAPKDVSVSLLEKRRTQAIRLQKDRRTELLTQLRRLDNIPDISDSADMVSVEEEEEGKNENEVVMMPLDKLKKWKIREKRRKMEANRRNQRIIRELEYANLFMIPEWLIEAPRDLGEEWTVMARPVGRRCIVRSSGRKTTCRGKHGGLMFYFNSKLPNGSPDQQKKGGAILDCIWHEESAIFFVVDIIRWNGVEIGQNPWDFRAFWRESKLAELQLGEISSKNEFKFSVVPCYQSNPKNLRKAYQETSYEIDGLLFYHLKGEYCSGPSPLVHLWKDSNCSKWHITSNDGKKPNKHQSCALELKGSKEKGWWLESREHIVLAKLPVNINLSFKSRVKKLETPVEGFILKWLISNLDLTSHTAEIIKYQGLAHKRRNADLYSKIAFQFQARSECGVSFEALEKATKSKFIDRMSGMNDLLMATE